jgi:hypothetical protein
VHGGETSVARDKAEPVAEHAARCSKSDANMASAALGGCKKLSNTVPSPHGPRSAPNKALYDKALSEAQALSHLHSNSPGLHLFLRFM